MRRPLVGGLQVQNVDDDDRQRKAGKLGATTYLVWWGMGTWPLWLAAIPAVLWLVIGRSTPARRVVAFWSVRPLRDQERELHQHADERKFHFLGRAAARPPGPL